MTANKIFLASLDLLGYSGINGDKSGLEVLESRAVCAINQILADLSVNIEISTLEDTLAIQNGGNEVLIYGVAMLLALSIDDAEKNRFFATIYNRKRTSYKVEIAKINDVLPSSDGGV